MIEADVIVVGLGAMGSAALAELSLRGVRAIGLEQFGIPHGEGSSGGDTRLIRKAYFEHPDYVPLLERAYENWRALEADTGVDVLHETGTLYFGQADSELMAGSRRSATEHGLALQAVDAAALRTEFPQFCCPEGFEAAFEPEAGFLLCERAIRVQVDRALSHGAQVLAGEPVTGWQATHGGVEVTTASRRCRAGALVLTAGSWSGGMLASLGLDLTVTRQPLFWIRPREPEAFALGRAPCWAVQTPDQEGLFYGFPSLPATMTTQLGTKLAQHAPGEEVVPGAPRRPAEPAELERLLAVVAPFMPGLAGPQTGSRVCTYTLSADGHFLVDRHPEHDNVVLACGFSGHGFKFASALGEALADLALEGSSPLPVEFLRLR